MSTFGKYSSFMTTFEHPLLILHYKETNMSLKCMKCLLYNGGCFLRNINVLLSDTYAVSTHGHKTQSALRNTPMVVVKTYMAL